MKALHSLLFVALLALSAWVVSRPPATRSAHPSRALEQPQSESSSTAIRDLALPGAALLASLDLAALRRNVWGRAALEQLLPSDAKGEACARAALADVQRLVLAIPSASTLDADPEFAVLAEGPLPVQPLLDCAARVLRARGGAPSLHRLGSFQTLRDEKGRGELAVRSGGPLIVSGGGYFRALVERVGAPPLPQGPREEVHVALRRELGLAPLQLTWVLPAGWLEGWLEDPAVKSSPLADVRAVSLRGELNDLVSLAATIDAENAESAARIESFLRAARLDFAESIDAYLGPGASEQIRLARSGVRVELALRLGTRALAARWLSASPPPATSFSHPLGSAHAQEREPDRQRAP